MVSGGISAFSVATVESVATALGELYSGTELTRILAQIKLTDPHGEGMTKWRRLAAAMDAQQSKQGDGRPVVALISAAMSPDRTLDRRAKAAVARDQLDQVLSLSGYRITDEGKVSTARRATTDSEAAGRSKRLHTLLAERGGHPEVIKYCRPDLLRTDCYEAVFEAVKGLGDRLRTKCGLDQDGRALVQASLRGKPPLILLNGYATVTERNEQEGVALLAEGLFAAFRNPAAHQPQLVWSVSEQDALDVLGTLSMIHRRLDDARPRS